MKNILIIGGTGFIGSNILEALKCDNHNIFLITSRKDLEQLKNSKVKVIQGSLNETNLIKKIISEHGIEVILHLASNLIPSSSKRQFDEEMRDIVLPTFELFNYISEKNLKIIYFSSGGTIYGNADGKILENTELKPINYYGYSKLIIENHIKLLARVGNLKYIILRPSNVYGKYQRIESKQGFIAVALGKMLSNQDIEIWGDGKIVRDYVDVSDIARAVRGVIDENIENKIFNLGSGEGHSLTSVVKFLEKYLNRSATIIYKDKREVDVEKTILDISSLESFIDYNPKKLDEGIKDFIAHLSKQRTDGK